MELLVADNVTRFRNGEALFAPFGLRLRDGDRLGLVGANGSGKSTLLHLLAGLELPDEGAVSRAPGVRVALLAQAEASPPRHDAALTVMSVAVRALEEVRAAEARLRTEEARIAAGENRSDAYVAVSDEHERLGGYRAESRLREYLAALGFTEADHDRPVRTLSAGQWRRLELAKVLAQGANVLLLDEPTNHLDIPARSWLAARLDSWRGALIVVSHDRALLAASTRNTAFLSPDRRLGSNTRSRLRVEPGAYDVAKLRLEAVHRSDDKREQSRRKEAARLEAMAQELRGFGRKAVARRASAVRRRDELRLLTPSQRPDRGVPRFTGARGLASNEGVRTAPGVLLQARRLALPGVLDSTDVRLQAGQRIALLGANGSGKSALLALLRGALPSSDPRSELRFRPGLKLRHLDQVTRGLEDDSSVLEQAQTTFGNVTAGRLLAQAGLEPGSWSQLPGKLSGGERARVGLAITLNLEADLWLLDEPSNDLDLAATEALEAELDAKLVASGAALLLVTHDRRLAERLCSEFWALRGAKLERYADVAAYLTNKPIADAAVDGTQGTPPAGENAVGNVAEDKAGNAAGNAAGNRADDARTVVDNAVTTVPDQTVPDPSQATERLERLEDERTELLRLSEQLGRSERDKRRQRERLAWLESELMVAYAARLPPAAPRYRLREGRVLLFADELPTSGSERIQELHSREVRRIALVAASDASAATAHLAQLTDWPESEPGSSGNEGAAWLELRVTDSVCHLRLLESDDACLLPAGRSVLINGATRLAFTHLGAQAVQLFWRDERLEVTLRPAGDGWWALGLGEFLLLEGWSKEQPLTRARFSSARRARKRRRSGHRGGP